MTWRLFCDGASRGNPGPAAFGFVLCDPAGEVALSGRGPLGRATNNEAEYQALDAALAAVGRAQAAGELDCDGALEVCLDSQLVVRQLTGVYRVKAGRLRPLFQQARARLVALGRDLELSLRHVPREQNAAADRLANLALDERDGQAG